MDLGIRLEPGYSPPVVAMRIRLEAGYCPPVVAMRIGGSSRL